MRQLWAPISKRTSVWLRKFFRIRLLQLGPDELGNYLKSLEREVKALKEECIRIAWYMRGGIPYDQALELGYDERSIIAKIVKENADASKKSGQLIY